MSDTSDMPTTSAPFPDRPPPGAGESESTQVQSAPPTHLLQPTGLPAVPGLAVTRELARGGMGVVYAADDPVFGREVAVKVMHHGQDAGRFVIESKVTARLPHPGVPPVYALGELPDGRPFLAMKLIEGRTLADELKAAGRSDLPRLLGAFERICETVGFAHTRGVVHRDLKPANVMVGAFGELLVMDWGLATEGRGANGGARAEGGPEPSHLRSEVTVAGQVKGTPAYMAPEQARGEPVGPRADVFALGGVLAAILTGRPPFAGGTVADTVHRAARAEVGECFAALGACGADSELVAIARTCLAPAPADRYADGTEVAAVVAAYRAGVEERLRRAERDRAVAAAEAREQRKRRRVQTALAAAVALSLAAAGAGAWYADRRAAEQKLRDERAEADRDRAAAERRAVEERLAGERDAEHRLKAEQARRGVAADLALAIDLRRQYKFKEAGAALAQAADLARGGAPELLAGVEQARADLAFVSKLDDVRFRKWVWVPEAGGKGYFNEKIAPPEYRGAFAGHGLDLTALPPAGAAGRIASSAVRAELVAAVDDWALYEPDPALRDRLLEVARRADPGSWTDRLRDPAVRADKAALERLADDAGPAPSSAALSVLAILMARRGSDPAPVLSAARAKNPTDFELAFVLGRWYSNRSDDRALGPYEAARALRPESLTVWLNLGVVLHHRGDRDGALAAWKEAVRLDPTDAIPKYNVGWALYSRGDLEGAIAAWTETVRLDPKFALAHYDLGVVLNDKGDVPGAIAAWTEATRLNPRDPKAATNLGAAYAMQGKYPEAIVWARAAIAADPGYANAHAMLGLSLLALGDVSGARAATTEAARLDPKKWGALLARLPYETAPPPREVKR